MKTKIEIKSVYGEILFEYEKENNSLKDTVIEAVNQNANLRYANLKDANLRYANLIGADLIGANLIGANLIGANLIRVNLRYTNLSCADLSCANLRDANLSCADLRYADLSCANLRGADLSCADIRDANLRDANLRGADLSCADIRDATLRDAKNIPFIPLACPSDGAFVGWKKVDNNLIKLQIPEDAKRCSATTNKCRCDKALVLSITDLKNNEEIKEITNKKYAECVYKVGEMVYPDSFNNERWAECSNGIHFFVNKQEAINY